MYLKNRKELREKRFVFVCELKRRRRAKRRGGERESNLFREAAPLKRKRAGNGIARYKAKEGHTVDA